MNRDEQDWINALNATGNLANTLAKTEAQGLQTDAYLKEKADKEEANAASNTMAMGLNAGVEPSRLLQTDKAYTSPEWARGYAEINKGLPAGQQAIAPSDFTTSSDQGLKIGAAVGLKSLNDTLRQRVEAFKGAEDLKVQDIYNRISKMSEADVLKSKGVVTGSFSEFGEDAAAASRAYSLWLANHSQKNIDTASVVENRKKIVSQKWQEHNANVSNAETFLRAGRYEDAKNSVLAAVNDSLVAHKAEATDDDRIKLKITTEGKDGYSEESYTVPELLEKIKSIGYEQFASNTFGAIELKKQNNIKYAKDPVYLIDKKGNVIQATARDSLFSSDFKWYATLNGKEIGLRDLSEFGQYGFERIDAKKAEDENKSRANGLTMDKVQISNATKEGLIKDAQLKALNSKTEEKNVQLIRDRRRQATNAFAQDAWSSGIDIKVDPETGDVMIDKVLTRAQADYVNKLAAIHGFKAALRKEKDGIDNGWFRFDTDGYRFGGVSENKNQRAKGLSVVEPNTQSGKVMSKGEFDATITGQENKQPPVKTGKGLIERAYNSVVPADGFADTVVKKGFGPIPGQAKELAGVVYEKGLKPIPGQVKGVAKAVAKPFAAPYSAAAKLTKLKVLKNQLSHAESDKEKKEIKAEIEALSKSK